MSILTNANVLSLSVPARIQLVEDIWDTVAEMPEEVVLTDEQKAEIDRRLDAYQQNPDEGSPWGMVRERIRSFEQNAAHIFLKPRAVSENGER